MVAFLINPSAGAEKAWRPKSFRPNQVTAPQVAPAVAELGRPIPLQASGVPSPAPSFTARGQSPETNISLSGPPPVDPPVANPTFQGIPGVEGYNAGAVVDQPLQRSLWDRCFGWIQGPAHSTNSQTHSWFLSDCAFDELGLISPVSNPFLFEDPRSLTELRPIFYYQTAPGSNPVFAGGSSEFFGLQARVAFTERWSLVINKLGFAAIQPKNNDAVYQDGAGFAELWLGPKWTFLRNEQTGTVAAVGLTFQVPVGSSKVFQNTGSLSLDPYITVAQNFGQSSYGSFNFVGAAGYSAGVDSDRSDYFHSSLHLDYDIARMHRWYPLLELNWFYYTNSGGNLDQSFEGMDLINFGAEQIAGRSMFTIAGGLRYKASNNFQIGVAAEAPLTAARDLTSFRLTVDMIFRY